MAPILLCRVSAGDDVVKFQSVPFTVANACQQTGNRQVALKTQPNVSIVI